MSEKAMTTRTTALDGLRGLCALMVVLSHLNIDATTINRVAPGWWHIIQPLVGKGTLYVAVLFVLTGYLMSSIYGRIHSWVNFMQRRYTRLFPLFITVSIFQTYYYFAVIMEKNRPNTMIIAAQCLGFAFVCGGLWRMYIKIRARSSGTILFRSFFILQLVVMAIYIAVVMRQPPDFIYHNYSLFKVFTGLINTTLTFPFGTYIPMVNGSFWSLAPEVIYYAIYPLIVIPYMDLIRKSGLYQSIVLIVCMCCVLLSCTIAFESFLGMKGLYPHFWLYFFIGNILAIKYDRLMALCAKWERYRLFNILLTALSTLPFILFASSTTFVNKPNDPVLYMLFLPFPFFLMLSALRQTSLISRILSTRPLVAVGTISYSLYLTHFIVVELLLVDSKIPFFWTISDLGSYVSTAFISSLGLAYIFYILLEKPYFFSRIRGKSNIKVSSDNSVSSSKIALFCGVYILLIFSGLQREYSLSSITHAHNDARTNSLPLPDTVSFNETKKVVFVLTAVENNFGILSIPIRYAGTLTFQVGRDMPLSHSIQVTVQDMATGAVISHNVYKGTQFDPELKAYPFGFPKQVESKGKKYLISIESTHATPGDYTVVEHLRSDLLGVYQLEKSALLKSPSLLSSALMHKLSLIVHTQDFWLVLALNVIPFATFIYYKRSVSRIIA